MLLIPSARRKTQWNLYLTRRNEICTPLNRPDFSPNLSGKRGKAFRFTNAWEQRKLKELATFNPKAEIPDTFEYVDLESVSGSEMTYHRTENKRSAPSRAQRVAQKGDLFYQTVRPYQKNNYLFDKDEYNYVFSTGYAQLRPKVSGVFLLGLVQSDSFVKTVLNSCHYLSK